MVSKDDTREFNTTSSDLLEFYGEKKPPAMPCYTAREKKKEVVALPATATASGNGKTFQRPHDERHAGSAFTREEFQTMIHTAIPDSKIHYIDGARKAVSQEWDKLFKLEAFALEEMMAPNDVVEM